MTAGIDFRDGLLPCAVQDASSGEVLMLAFVNEEALALTLRTREMHFWSRSRGEIWRKGATSGNTQKVVRIAVDCDKDCFVVVVRQKGVACHTGKRSCFFREIDPPTGELREIDTTRPIYGS